VPRRAAATAFALLVFGGAFGVGFGLVASALIRNEDVPQGGAAADPAHAASPETAPQPERRILGFLRDS
jgi:hypothetical protein